MHFLTVAGIFKNESHIIKEWIQHYLNEGVDHFILIDNGSTDNYQDQIKEFLDKGLVTIIYDNTRWAQIELYNKYFPDLKDQTEWLLICDLDEFVYGRNGYKTISSFLRDIPEVGVVRIPWKVFGSSSHIQQPEKVVPSFTMRAKQDRVQKPWMPDKKKTLSKIIVRPELISRFHLHFCYLKGKCRIIAADKKKIKYPRDNEKKHFQPVSEKILRRSYLHLNHYAIQSLDWFKKIKMSRGDASTERHEAARTLAYFEEYDQASSDIMDDELANKIY